MPETIMTLPDGTRLVVYTTSSHPDISGEAKIQETLQSDIPTYHIHVEGVVPTSGKNLLSVFNNLPSTRMRVQRVYAYPRTSGNNTVTLVMGYINSVPVSGTQPTPTFTPLAADFPNNPAPPDRVVYLAGNTSPQPLSGLVFGGARISLNAFNKVEIFNADLVRNGSALQLRPQADGFTVKQVEGGNQGSLNLGAVFVID